MIFWDELKLVKKIREGKLTDREKYLYYLIFSLFHFTGYALLSSFPKKNDDLIPLYASCLSVFVNAFIIFISVSTWYQTNSRGDNKNFIERCLCLSIPLSIRYLVYEVLVWVVLMLFTSPFVESLTVKLVLAYMSVFLSLILRVFYLYSMNRALSAVSKERENHSKAMEGSGSL